MKDEEDRELEDWEPELDPLPFVRSAREQLVEFARVEEQLAPDAVRTPVSDEKVFTEAMSTGLRAALEDYKDSSGGTRVQLLHYTRSVDGKVDLLLDSGQQAPDEDRLVHLTSATSAADRTGLRVVAEVLVAARAKL